MYQFPTFSNAINYARDLLRIAPVVHSGYWQGVDIRKMPEAATHEVMHYSFRVPMSHGHHLVKYREDIKPDIPWADDHFEERVSGVPLNPSPSEAWWPHAPAGQGNSKFMKDYGDGKPCFSHTYPERMWPKPNAMHGQRFPYGDLDDVVSTIVEDPYTRQAFLPIWWPEDGNAGVKERKPCTLGYHFITRLDNAAGIPRLDITYYIRSCDYAKHFRNDIYMTVRLALWVIQRARELSLKVDAESRDYLWNLEPGKFLMHITSLHLFRNDYIQTFGA